MSSAKTYVYLCTFRTVWSWNMPSTKAHLYVFWSVGYRFGIRAHDICGLFLVYVFCKSLRLIVYIQCSLILNNAFTKAHLYVCWSKHYRFGIRVHDICGLFLVYVLRKSLRLIMYMLFTKVYYLIVTLYKNYMSFHIFLYFGPVALYMLNKLFEFEKIWIW